MESGPPKIIQLLIPPACREEVVGDLREESPGLVSMLLTVISVIASRIRRTSDPVVLLMEALALYTAFVVVAGWLAPALLFDPAGLLTLAVPPAATLIGLMLIDAYSDPKEPLRNQPLVGVALGAALAVTAGGLFIPRVILMAGIGFGSLLILPVRTFFPPPTARPQSASAPAYWQKLELPPLADFTRQVAAGVIVALVAIIVIAVFTFQR